MKKILFIIIASFLVIIFIIAVYCYRNPSVGSFSLEEYSQEIEQFPGDESFGEIQTAREAIDVAKTLWEEQYDELNFRIPYRVFYDEVNRVWLVRGSICFVFPSGPFLLISETDGKVLAMWNEKF